MKLRVLYMEIHISRHSKSVKRFSEKKYTMVPGTDLIDHQWYQELIQQITNGTRNRYNRSTMVSGTGPIDHQWYQEVI